MQLRFPLKDIRQLSDQYLAELGERDTRLTTKITTEVFPAYRKRGQLTKPEFLAVCEWKSPRTKPRCASNDDGEIAEVSRLVLRTNSEKLRITLWTLLSGVSWPTASVFLHFSDIDRYPILDYRALWSLGFDDPPPYTFTFWWEYVTACRELSTRADVSMQVLDHALWKYSELNQPTSSESR